MINFINRFILLFTEKDCYGNTIHENKIYNNNKNNLDGSKYYEIIKKVRNFVSLDNSDIEFIKKLQLKELVEIIEILNIHSEIVNELLNNNENV
jgi:hypothetical protein